MTAQNSQPAPYDEQFFNYTSSISKISARAVVPVVASLVPGLKSVADFGCAQGVWLACWRENGIEDVQGVDGDYVDQDALAIPRERFTPFDLNAPIDLGRRFDMAYSLEVAEHLRPENSAQFVKSLTRHADVVLFSAAPPGQGGESHINERSFDDWRALFKAEGFNAYDCVRPRIQSLGDVSFWYRYNVFLYVREGAEDRVGPDVAQTRIPDGEPMKDVSPPLFKLRKFLIRLLPYPVQNTLARIKASLVG